MYLVNGSGSGSQLCDCKLILPCGDIYIYIHVGDCNAGSRNRRKLKTILRQSSGFVISTHKLPLAIPRFVFKHIKK